MTTYVVGLSFCHVSIRNAIENATVMKYDAGGDVVLSIADSFSKAESLIRRRIKDSAVDVLMEL